MTADTKQLELYHLVLSAARAISVYYPGMRWAAEASGLGRNWFVASLIAGREPEAFTFLWYGAARTAEELVILLPFRGHTLAAYRLALAELLDLGWIEEDGGASGRYHLTEKGRKVREEAERITDRVFFAPWQTLSASELLELEGMLAGLRDAAHVAARAMPVAA